MLYRRLILLCLVSLLAACGGGGGGGEGGLVISPPVVAAPVLTSQPASQGVVAGQPVAFSVAVQERPSLFRATAMLFHSFSLRWESTNQFRYEMMSTTTSSL